MNESQHDLDAQFRREARMGSFVIGLAFLGFLAAAYFRLSGGFQGSPWVGTVPPLTQPISEKEVEPQLAQHSAAAPSATAVLTRGPAQPSRAATTPTMPNRQQPGPEDLQAAPRAVDTLAGRRWPQGATSDDADTSAPPLHAVPSYDVLSRLRPAPPATNVAALLHADDPVTPVGAPPARYPALPGPLTPSTARSENPEPLPRISALAATPPTITNSIAGRPLPPPPHLHLPSGTTLSPPETRGKFAPLRTPRNQPDSTATLPLGSRQQRVVASLDSAVTPASFTPPVSTRTLPAGDRPSPAADPSPRPTRLATVVPVRQEPTTVANAADQCLVAGVFHEESSLRDQEMYLTADGDTLFRIAADRLGQASRYLELLELNRGILPPAVGSSTPLAAGLPLRLPQAN